jgi:hypothetical protein
VACSDKLLIENGTNKRSCKNPAISLHRTAAQHVYSALDLETIWKRFGNANMRNAVDEE